ncbi:hypothetical protein HaLaN_10312 [Haematococcus lacustris]|uniref:Uncharacterized protein n=1 Tax=Haematococcus lacustris TaxID=44745 RepID=A0A699YYH3_HAELA|nr:hypothetical protein HaLaN_10312 [Haematococcus lacustris]
MAAVVTAAALRGCHGQPDAFCRWERVYTTARAPSSRPPVLLRPRIVAARGKWPLCHALPVRVRRNKIRQTIRKESKSLFFHCGWGHRVASRIAFTAQRSSRPGIALLAAAVAR